MKYEMRFGNSKTPLYNKDIGSTYWEWYFPSDTAYISGYCKNELEFEGNLIRDYFRIWSSRIYPEDLNAVLSYLAWYLKEKAPYYNCEYRVRNKNNEYIWILSRGKAFWNSNGKLIKMAGLHTNITERKCMEKRLKYLSQHDPATGIPLTPLFLNRLEKEIANAQSYFAVLYLHPKIQMADTGRFNDKNIEKLMIKIITNINNRLSSKDLLCRISENEYALLIGGVTSKHSVDRKLAELINYSRTPFIINNHLYTITMNIGAAIYPMNGRSAKVLLKNSSLAMHRSKILGPNKYCYYNSILIPIYY